MVMEINRRSHDYHLIDTWKNVYREVAKDAPAGSGSEPQPSAEMVRLLRRLEATRPKWMFVTQQNYSATRFHIFEGREWLGQLMLGYRGSNRTYQVENRRTGTQRKRYKETGDIEKALKLVYTHIYPMADEEKSAVFASALTSELSGDFLRANNAFNAINNRLLQTFSAALQTNWPATKAFLASQGASKDLIEAPVGELVADKEAAHQIFSAGSTGRGSQILYLPDGVMVNGAKYPELPEQLRYAVGVLKLVDNHTRVNGIGYRIDDEAFFVLEQLDE